jgi:hypothetical protein
MTREPARPSIRKRRSLSHVGGPAEVEGPAPEAALLARALDVERAPAPRAARWEARDDDPDRVHVHGFHSYPARMHPATAARLVEVLVPPGGRVLDPFCGSGTVLVEALLAGREAIGRDASPLAVALSWLKVRPRRAVELAHLRQEAQALRAEADRRRKTRAGATRRYPPEDVELFEPHVLLELDSLSAGIERLEDDGARRDLSLVLSAILIKVSRQQGDTGETGGPRRVAPGYTSLLFRKKAEELADRLAAMHDALPDPPARAEVRLDDAASLTSVRPRSVDAVITSPPYVATYDYLAHHAVRLRWLGLESRLFSKREVGSRRRYARLSPTAARSAWTREVAGFLGAIAKVVRPGAPVALLLADSAIGATALRADEILREAMASLPLELVARASQERPHFHRATQAAFREAPRREHALLLRRR